MSAHELGLQFDFEALSLFPLQYNYLKAMGIQEINDYPLELIEEDIHWRLDLEQWLINEN